MKTHGSKETARKLSDAQYRELIPLYTKHRDENAADAVIASETTAQWKAYLQGVIDGIDLADAKDQEAAEANAKRDAGEVGTDTRFSSYINWIKAQFGPNSPEARSLAKRGRGSSGGGSKTPSASSNVAPK